MFSEVLILFNNFWRIHECKNILKLMKDKQVEFVDLRFTDPRGKLQHVTMDAGVVDDELLNDGVFLMAHQ